ncbi:MAG: AzlD domain-containing protein [Actinobacteria bacterium]|nr:AzlD domain-containing protein [Actinomycetota bacterium]
MSDTRALAVILTISVVTVLLRSVPFLALERLAGNSYLRYLGTKMPTGVMVLLVAYTLKNLDLTKYPYGLPSIGALLLSAGLYWRTSNSLSSIGLGLALYLLAVNCIV